MKKAREFLLLAIFGMSLFLLIIAPIEIHKTIDARSWDAVRVTIVAHQIKSAQNHYYPEIRIRDHETEEMSQAVSVRYGDIAWSAVVVSTLLRSTLTADLAEYPAGREITAFRSPDGTKYLLEQNSIRTMLVVLLLACIYPVIAIWSIATKQSKRPVADNTP